MFLAVNKIGSLLNNEVIFNALQALILLRSLSIFCFNNQEKRPKYYPTFTHRYYTDNSLLKESNRIVPKWKIIVTFEALKRKTFIQIMLSSLNNSVGYSVEIAKTYLQLIKNEVIRSKWLVPSRPRKSSVFRLGFLRFKAVGSLIS